MPGVGFFILILGVKLDRGIGPRATARSPAQSIPSSFYPALPQVYAAGVTILPSPMFGAIMQIILTRLLSEIEMRRWTFALPFFRGEKYLDTFCILANPFIWKDFKTLSIFRGAGDVTRGERPTEVVNLHSQGAMCFSLVFFFLVDTVVGKFEDRDH